MTTTAQPLHWLLLGPRPHNALYRAGVRTVGDVADMSEDDLRDIHGFGAKSVAEVVAALATIGLTLRSTAPLWGALSTRPGHPVASAVEHELME